MKNLLISVIFFSLISCNLFGEISVKSFRKLENDMTARIDAPKKDQNGDVCAVIKIVTTQTGFVWEPDGLGIISSDWKNGEYWLYVPYGAKHLTIKHDKLGILRDYMYPLPIEKACVYEMVLTTGKVITTVDETIESQWLVITPEPADAAIYIEDAYVKTGSYQAKMKPGSYTYRVEAPLYHSEAGKVEVTDAKKEISVKLNPAFGYITVNTEPEKDAKVIIDGKALTQNTPCKSEAIASGEHTVQVLKEMYQPALQKVTVTDGQTTPVNLIMQPNFAEVTITAPSDADIYINSKEKGTGTWSGRLNPGVYSVEASKDKHRSAKQDIEVIAGDKKTINLQPTPIYGSLDVISIPLGATITIDSKDCGTTPNTINNLLIGSYTMLLRKTGYATVSHSVNITDGKITELTVTLENGRTVNINSTSKGASLYIDGIASGSIPYNGSLTFGNHILRIEKDGKETEKAITINQTDGETNFTLDFWPQSVTDIDGNVYHIVTIGTQTWMVENLKVTRYRNGEPIPNITDNKAWTKLKKGAICDYDNKPSNSETYGKLYNWYAVSDNRNIAPAGWHVPTDAEWTILTDYLGGEKVAGGKLKETGTTHWTNPNTAATNESGFSALPGGYRSSFGSFLNVGIYGYRWSATEYSTSNAWYRFMSYIDSSVFRIDVYKQDGFSVRCVRDF